MALPLEARTCADAEFGVGHSIYALIERLYPICRSITGPGVRETLAILSELHPIEVTETPTGASVFDWTVPREWVIRDAYIADVHGRRVVDFRAHTLHVLNYSTPVDATMTLSQLRPHLHTLPNQPDLIPYRTSYYSERWGFCLSQRTLDAMDEGPYRVVIDSELKDGSLSVGEIFIPGQTDEEILVSTHVCHPSLANDNLSAVGVAIHLAQHFSKRSLPRGLRFVFCPGTIGSISWLARNEHRLDRIAGGLVITGCGDESQFVYKRSRRGATETDRAAEHVLKHRAPLRHRVVDFSPYGYDERQYCSPGIDLAVGRLSRAPHGTYPEYHTSADDLTLVSPKQLAESFDMAAEILEVMAANETYLSLNPKGEPQLGKRGLYRHVAGQAQSPPAEMAMLWVLAYADGAHSLLDVAERAALPFVDIRAAADALLAADLIKRA